MTKPDERRMRNDRRHADPRVDFKGWSLESIERVRDRAEEALRRRVREANPSLARDVDDLKEQVADLKRKQGNQAELIAKLCVDIQTFEEQRAAIAKLLAPEKPPTPGGSTG